MSSVIGQVIVDAQRMANRIKDLDTLGSTLLVEAEGNNRLMESLRQFQDDVDSLNRISNNKSNIEMVNRIQQQNANSSEILKENRELKICIEDYERAMELIMQKYREHSNTSILESKVNFRDVYNEKLWKIIREQRVKINEMAAVMQRAATVDDDAFNRELELMTHLRLENKTLRELLHCGSANLNAFCKEREFMIVEKGIQTDGDESTDELSLSGISIENVNNSVLQLNSNNSPNDEINIATTIVTTKANSEAQSNICQQVSDNTSGIDIKAPEAERMTISSSTFTTDTAAKDKEAATT